MEFMQMHDTVTPEQVIEVPKLSHDCIPQRSAVRRPQKAEQLVEVPTEPAYVLAVIAIQAMGLRAAVALAEQIVDNPVPQGRRGGGGLQGSRAGQNSTAADAEQIVDIPARTRGLQGLRPGQNSTALGGAVHVDIPVPSGRGGRVGWGGLQGFSQEQNSTASCGAELVDIPVPSGRGAGGGLHEFSPGQGSRASSSCSRAAEVAFDGIFRTFPGVKKSAEVAGQVSAKFLHTQPHGRRRLMAMALCRVMTVARGTSSRTVTRRRRRRKKSSRCSTSLSTGSNSLAGDPDASAVTTWQAAVHAGGAARLLMASKSFTRHPFLVHFVDVPVLQIMDEVDAAVKGSGEGGGGGVKAKVAAVGCCCALDAAPWHCWGTLIKR